MIRNLKALGLALVAVFAMSAMAASAASAQQGIATADGYPVTLDGSDIGTGNNIFSAFGNEVECPGSTYASSGPIEGATTDITIEANYNNAECHTVSGLKATVHMNDCDYDFHVGVTTPAENNEGTYGVTADLNCETSATGYVQVTVFLSASNENIKACTLKMEPQTGLKGAHLTDNGEGDIVLSGTAEGIKASRSGLCGSGTTEEATYKTNVTVTGTNEAGKATSISISEE